MKCVILIFKCLFMSLRDKFSAIYILTIFILVSCSSTKELPTPVTMVDNTETLQTMMTGSYDSSKQAEVDSAYFNISLHMYPIWEKRKDGKYLYVEQAVASMQDRPYRQRIYKLKQLDNGRIASYVFTLKQESLFIGKWKTPEYFDKFGLTLIDERVGCEVILEKTETGYQGSTQEDNCGSTLRGASYATSVVSMSSDAITSWDQGFDKDGKQVWGAVKGPYVFEKLK